MEQSKIISVDVDISLKETNIRTLDAVLFSRDVNAPKIRFKITKDGEELSDSTSASLLLTASNYRGELKDGLNIKLNGTVTNGEVTFALPNDILGYQGLVRADLYIYWDNGSNDGTQPILFSVKRSALDSTASTMSVVYVDEFEVEKARVTKAANDAIEAIDTNEVIKQFEADKKAVTEAKDSAITEINTRPDELDNAISNATAKINAKPEELDGIISTATADIKAQSDSVDLSASAAKNQINVNVLAVDSVKDTAIIAINAAPSKLDEPINTAQNIISQSVNNVSNVETGAIDTINAAISVVNRAKITATDSINKSVDDVQNASTSAISDIEAVKPSMLQQFNDIETNINNLIELQEKNAIYKVHTAWANNADGTEDFTTVYPNLNLLDGTKDFSGNWVNYNPLVVTDKYKGLSVFPKQGQWNGVYKNFTVPSDGDYTFSCYYKVDGSATAGYFLARNGVGEPKETINSNNNNWGIFKHTFKNCIKGQLLSSRVEKNNSLAGTVYVAGHKYEPGSTATPYMPSSSEVKTSDWPKYRGLGVLSSVTPTDYVWEQSDTYRDYKEQQLKTAIIALGGTL